MARTFTSASSERITFGLGATGSMTGAVSLAAIVRADADANTRIILYVGSDPSGRYALYRNATNGLGAANTTVGTDNVTCSFSSANGWVLVGWSKASGTATPRGHRYIFNTNAWTHANQDNSFASITPASSNTIGATSGATLFWGGGIAIAGAWSVALTDDQWERLAYDLNAWFQAQPTGLWVLDQATTSMLVPDLSGGGANQTAITGTTISTSAVPGFSYGAPILTIRGVPGPTDCSPALESADYLLLEDDVTALGLEACTPIDSDTGTGTDAGESIAAMLTQADTATGTDAESVTTTITDPDTGAVTETAALAAALTDADSGSATESESIVVAGPNPKTETITEDFTTDHLGVFDAQAYNVTAVGGRMFFDPTLDVASTDASGSGGTGRYDLTDSYVFAEVEIELDPDGVQEYEFRVQVPFVGFSGFKVVFDLGVWELQFRGDSGPFAPDLEYDPVAHRWLRIRESAGTIYYDTSPDGITWTEQESFVYSFEYTAVYPYFAVNIQDDNSWMYVDNVNVPGVAVAPIGPPSGHALLGRPIIVRPPPPLPRLKFFTTTTWACVLTVTTTMRSQTRSDLHAELVRGRSTRICSRIDRHGVSQRNHRQRDGIPVEVLHQLDVQRQVEEAFLAGLLTRG